MVILGLTGSIGMGKSTTAALFAEQGVAVHDSDAAVHALYAGPKVDLIEAAFPGVVIDGKVDRGALSRRVIDDKAEMRKLEAIVHPIVGDARRDFLAAARARGDAVVVLDIPLLFEIGGERDVDAIVVVTAPAEIQRARVLARPGMNAAKFETILAKQTPDAEKRGRAHFVVDTAHGVEFASRRVMDILRCARQLRGR